jgi:hypothetical protein
LRVRRLTVSKEGLTDAGLKLAGAVVFVVFFLAVVVGGGVYRTDCISNSGQLTRTWALEGDIPYLWSPGDNHCQAHTLTRYLLGKVGIMGDVDR